MSDADRKTPRPPPATDRAGRLEAQLKANIARRKAAKASHPPATAPDRSDPDKS